MIGETIERDRPFSPSLMTLPRAEDFFRSFSSLCSPPCCCSGMDKLPYDVLEEVFQLAVGQDKCHGGEVYRWASHEEAYSLALVCRAWMAREWASSIAGRPPADPH